jgi:hypothetical protein
MTLTYLLIGLRTAALAIDLAGRAGTADQLYALSDALAAGRATEAHMAKVAELLKSREVNDTDIARVLAEIDASSAELRAPD